MTTLNLNKLKQAAPALEEITLDGKTDYQQVKSALLEAKIKPANRLVWDIINQMHDTDLAEAEDFYD